MKQQNYHTSITVNDTANEVFNCINNVTKWWTENLEGSSQNLNDEFTVRFDATWKTFKIIEFVPDKKVTWLVTDCYLPWNNDKKEWKGTKISFEISTQDDKTNIHFTHAGLVPEAECYDACSNAWNQYIPQSLWRLITTGKGQPEKKETKTKDKVKP